MTAMPQPEQSIEEEQIRAVLNALTRPGSFFRSR
jgi:hypothetical protein